MLEEEPTQSEINTSKTEILISTYIENNKSEELITLINTKLSKTDISNLRFGQNSESILHRLIIMDIQSLFISVFNTIKDKFDKNIEFIQFINYQDQQGNTALLYAVFKGDYEIVNILMENGADYKMRNYMGLSVMHMSSQGDKPSLLILFKDKYNFNVLDRDFNGNTPLHWAVNSTAENSINFLISWMNDVNQVDNKGQTVLHIAIHTLRPKLIKKLLFKGADIYKKNNNGESVYDIISNNEDNNKDFENIFRVITESKPMKYCIYSDNREFNNNNKCFGNKNHLIDSFLCIILHFLSALLIYFILLPFYNTFINNLLFFIILTLLSISFILVHLSDPGIVNSNIDLTWLEMVENKFYINNYCPYCKCQKNIKVKHCHICKKCINGFDHHCNWIDNCIGENNVGRFIFFVLMIIINLIFSYYIAFEAFVSREKLKPTDDNTTFFVFSWIYILNTKDMVAIFIMSISLFFFLPVLYVFWVQIKNRLFKPGKSR